MAMLQGNTYLIPFVIEDCDGNVITEKQIEKGEFVFGEIVKYYGVDGGVYWDEEKQVFVLPLSERETFSLQRAVKYQGRVLLKDGSVSGSKPESEYVYESIGTTILSDVESAGEESGKMLRVKLLDRVVDIGGVSDYNDLDNKPSIGGVVVEGERSIEDYGGATKNYVDERFNGANKSVSFVNYSLMINSLNSLGNESYNVGQNIMIVTLDVPDLWVSEIANESVVYTYVSDDDFINELKANGSVQVGYYKLSALETQKVDLTDYVKNTDYATNNKGGVVKVNETYGTRMVSGVLDIMPAQNSLIDSRQPNEYPLYMVNNYTRHTIVPANLDYAVKKALADCKIKGTTFDWTDTEKKNARDLLGAVGSGDMATNKKAGLVKVQEMYGIKLTSQILDLLPATNTIIDERASSESPRGNVGNNSRAVLVPANIDYAVKKALTDNKLEDGDYAWTDEEKAIVLEFLGAVKRTTGSREIYGNDWQGNPSTYRVDYPNDATVNGIPVRAANGAIQINDASCEDGGSGSIADGTQAVNKNYVKKLISESVGNLNTALETILGV